MGHGVWDWEITVVMIMRAWRNGHFGVLERKKGGAISSGGKLSGEGLYIYKLGRSKKEKKRTLKIFHTFTWDRNSSPENSYNQRGR